MQRVGLHQHPIELDCLKQLTLGLDLTTGIDNVDGLGNHYAQRQGIKTQLTNDLRYTEAVSLMEPRSVLPSQNRVYYTSATPGWPAIQLRRTSSKSRDNQLGQ